MGTRFINRTTKHLCKAILSFPIISAAKSVPLQNSIPSTISATSNIYTNVTTYDDGQSDEHQAIDQTTPKRKGYMIVKNNFLSFDVDGDMNEEGKILRIVEYCLNGYKDSELLLTRLEAKSLLDLLCQLETRPVEERQAELRLAEDNVFRITTFKRHIGYVFEIRHEKGLFKHNIPLKLPWSDSQDFLKFLELSDIQTLM